MEGPRGQLSQTLPPLPPPGLPTQTQTQTQPPPILTQAQSPPPEVEAPPPAPTPVSPLDLTVRHLLDKGGLIVPENITIAEQIRFISSNFEADLSDDNIPIDNVLIRIFYPKNGRTAGGNEDEEKTKIVVHSIHVYPFCAGTIIGIDYGPLTQSRNFLEEDRISMIEKHNSFDKDKDIDYLVVAPTSTVIELLSDESYEFHHLTIGNGEAETMPEKVVNRFLSVLGMKTTTVFSVKLEKVELNRLPLYRMLRFSTSLKELTLSMIDYDDLHETPVITWNDFSSYLQLHFSSTCSAHSLESVTVCYCEGKNLYSGMIKALQNHPTLRELDIHYSFDDYCEDLQNRYSDDLKQLAILLKSCPSLEKFSLGYGYNQSDTSIRHLIVEGLEHAKSLTGLALHNVDVRKGDARCLGNYLESNHSIQKLKLDGAFSCALSSRLKSSHIIVRSICRNKNIIDLELLDSSSEHKYGGIDQTKLLMQESRSLRRLALGGDGWFKNHESSTNPASPAALGGLVDVVEWFRLGKLTHIEELKVSHRALSRLEINFICKLIKTNNKNAHLRLRKFGMDHFDVSDDTTREEATSLLQNALKQNPFGFTDVSACLLYPSTWKPLLSTDLKQQLEKWNELSEDLTTRSKPLVAPMIPRIVGSMSNPSMIFNAIRGSLLEEISGRSGRSVQEVDQ